MLHVVTLNVIFKGFRKFWLHSKMKRVEHVKENLLDRCSSALLGKNMYVYGCWLAWVLEFVIFIYCFDWVEATRKQIYLIISNIFFYFNVKENLLRSRSFQRWMRCLRTRCLRIGLISGYCLYCRGNGNFLVVDLRMF